MFDVENYKLPKTNRNTKLICYSHEQGFDMWDDYRDHLLDKHFSDGLFNCEICNEKFTMIGDFNMYLRLHKEEKKRFEYSVYFKRFVAPYIVKRHMIVHTSNKKFTCESMVNGSVCGKAFKEEATLKRLIDTHSGKTFPCKHPNCTKKFKALHYMLDHYSLHHKHPLNGCMKTFRSRTTLKEHLKYWCKYKS